MDNQEDALFTTCEESIARHRRFFRVAVIVAPLAYCLFIALIGSGVERWFIALFFMCGLVGIMLLNGYRMVIGVRIYEDRLVIITPLSETSSSWEQIRVSYFFGRLDIYTKGAGWPYMLSRWRKQDRQATKLIRDKIRSL